MIISLITGKPVYGQDDISTTTLPEGYVTTVPDTTVPDTTVVDTTVTTVVDTTVPVTTVVDTTIVDSSWPLPGPTAPSISRRGSCDNKPHIIIPEFSGGVYSRIDGPPITPDEYFLEWGREYIIVWTPDDPTLNYPEDAVMQWMFGPYPEPTCEEAERGDRWQLTPPDTTQPPQVTQSTVVGTDIKLPATGSGTNILIGIGIFGGFLGWILIRISAGHKDGYV